MASWYCLTMRSCIRAFRWSPLLLAWAAATWYRSIRCSSASSRVLGGGGTSGVEGAVAGVRGCDGGDGGSGGSWSGGGGRQERSTGSPRLRASKTASKLFATRKCLAAAAVSPCCLAWRAASLYSRWRLCNWARGPGLQGPGGIWGLAKPGDEAGAVGEGPSRVTLGSGADAIPGAGWVGAGLQLGVDAGPFPMATGGGMSASSMALPFRTEASRFSSVLSPRS